jgi:hypothetical protein
MNRSKAALGWTAFLLATLLFAAVPTVSAPSQQGGSAAGLGFLDTNVPDFELRNETLVDGLWKLAKYPAPFAFGFENVLKESLTEQGTQERRLSVKLENKTVRQVLDALCQADPRFTWSMDGATVVSQIQRRQVVAR